MARGWAAVKVGLRVVVYRVCVAANLLEALFTPGSEHPALAMMEPVSQPPHSLLQAAAG